MTIIVSILIIMCAGILAVPLFVLRAKPRELEIYKKGAAVLLGACFAMRNMWGLPAYAQMMNFTPNLGASKGWNTLGMLLFWSANICVGVLCLAPFFKLRVIDKFVAFFCVPSCLLSAAFFTNGVRLLRGGV